MVATDREERSADNVAAAVWLIPFHHTEHCALDADKNTQSNKQKEKSERETGRGREREREYPIQFYLDDTASALGRNGKDGMQKKNTLN